VQITSTALENLKERVASNPWGARLKVSGGGCGGYTYELSHAESHDLTDIVYQEILVVDILSNKYLTDAILDWKTDDFSESFEIVNQQETGRCGCGESFYI
jgi:iron-sulfur cluster assembly protein